jgi:hypothetical protein
MPQPALRRLLDIVRITLKSPMASNSLIFLSTREAAISSIMAPSVQHTLKKSG